SPARHYQWAMPLWFRALPHPGHRRFGAREPARCANAGAIYEAIARRPRSVRTPEQARSCACASIRLGRYCSAICCPLSRTRDIVAVTLTLAYRSRRECVIVKLAKDRRVVAPWVCLCCAFGKVSLTQFEGLF